MEFKAKDIAEMLGGIVDGDENAVVNNVSKIEEGKPFMLAFLANPKYEEYIYTTEASIVLVDNDFVASKELTCTLIRVPSAYKAVASLLQMYEEIIKPRHKGIEQPSFIGEGVTIGEDVYIGAFSYIAKGAKIGKNVQIFPHAYIGDNVIVEDNTVINTGVKIYYGCKIGSNCTIHAGSVIGADGFGFAPSGSDYTKVSQIGNVVIEDYVEIGANVCIDRATMGSTIIEKGVKLDNLIQVAHNVVVGENTVMAAQCGVAGSTKIGKHCMIGGQVGFAGHIKIGDKVMIAAQSGISNNTEDCVTIMGSPAYDVRKYQRSYVMFRKLPDLYNTLRELEKEVKILKLKY